MGQSQLTREMAEVRHSFVREVARRAPVPAHVTVEATVAFVVSAVAERLTRGGAHVLFAALPWAIGSLFEGAIEAREEQVGPRSGLDRAELIRRTSDWLGVTPKDAERICSGVLSVVREWLPPSIADNVTAQLPKDLQELWLTTPDREAMPAPSWEPEVLQARIFAEIERAGVLPRNIDVADAFTAVMCTFTQRLSGGEARHVLYGLPSSLRPLVTTCMLHRSEMPDVFDRDELMRRVADHLATDQGSAELVVRAVLRSVKGNLPEKEVEDTASQLPQDLRALWMEA